ncbi:MAG: hypothetical protein ACI9YH_004229 [Colwellia sp.]|jgi:hypothetical protein
MKYLKDEYLNFKLGFSTRIPELMDFYLVDGAPNPIRYIKKERSYLNFISKVENVGPSILSLIADDVHDKYQRYLDGCLPIKRPHEFIIMSYLLEKESITLEKSKNEIEQYLDEVNPDTLMHAFEHINGNFFDSREKKAWPHFAELVDENGVLVLRRSNEFAQLAAIPLSKHWLLATLKYGLECYAQNFGSEYLGTPSLKLYQQYNMRDIALVANSRKTHSSYRGTGVLREGHDLFFFIDLHKEEGAIEYNDKFISTELFQWDSPSGCSPKSKQGVDILQHKEKGNRLHLFVRKFKVLDGVTEPYVYIGKGKVESSEGEKPINIQLKLYNQVPQAIYDEFVTETLIYES